MRRAAGDRFKDLELSMFATLMASANREVDAENLAHQRGWQASGREVLEMPTVLIGSVDQIAEDLQRRREELAISYIVVRDSQLADATPVAHRLAGT